MWEALGSPFAVNGFFGLNRFLLALSLYPNHHFFVAEDWHLRLSWYSEL
jgi:hypothetical protein